MVELAVVWESRLSVAGAGGANDQYGRQSCLFTMTIVNCSVGTPNQFQKCLNACFYPLESVNQIVPFGVR